MVHLAQLHLVENIVELPDINENEADLCHFSTLGGVYHLDILELPPQCKPVKGWVLVEVWRRCPRDHRNCRNCFTSFPIISASNTR